MEFCISSRLEGEKRGAGWGEGEGRRTTETVRKSKRLRDRQANREGGRGKRTIQRVRE